MWRCLLFLNASTCTWLELCLHFVNAARGTRCEGVCVFLMLQHVLDVEELSVLNAPRAARRGGVCVF